MCLRQWSWVLLVGLLLSVPTTAAAAVMNFCPSGDCGLSGGYNDIDDLDHRNFYTWRVTGVNLGGEDITKATIKFTQTYNWDDNPNKLYLQLLDDALNSGGTSYTPDNSDPGYQSYVRSYQDESADQGPRSDVFNNPGFTGTSPSYSHCVNNYSGDAEKQCLEQRQENNLVSPSTQEMFLTSRSFADLGTNPSLSPGEPSPPGWSVVADGSSSGNQLYTYTYTFDEGQEDTLQQFITSGQNFAIGLDPDCHIFNNGVMMTLTTGLPIPEPSALLLLGTGAAFVARFRRRFAAARA